MLKKKYWKNTLNINHHNYLIIKILNNLLNMTLVISIINSITRCKTKGIENGKVYKLKKYIKNSNQW